MPGCWKQDHIRDHDRQIVCSIKKDISTHINFPILFVKSSDSKPTPLLLITWIRIRITLNSDLFPILTYHVSILNPDNRFINRHLLIKTLGTAAHAFSYFLYSLRRTSQLDISFPPQLLLDRKLHHQTRFLPKHPTTCSYTKIRN